MIVKHAKSLLMGLAFTQSLSSCYRSEPKEKHFWDKPDRSHYYEVPTASDIGAPQEAERHVTGSTIVMVGRIPVVIPIMGENKPLVDAPSAMGKGKEFVLEEPTGQIEPNEWQIEAGGIFAAGVTQARQKKIQLDPDSFAQSYKLLWHAMRQNGKHLVVSTDAHVRHDLVLYFQSDFPAQIESIMRILPRMEKDTLIMGMPLEEPAP